MASSLSDSEKPSKSSSPRKSYTSRLSGGSFKGRFSTTGPAPWSKERTTSGGHQSDGGSSSTSSLSSTSSSLPGPGSSRSSLNRIASSASNFQSYASRYIDSIRPKSWGRTASGNVLQTPSSDQAVHSHSAGNSRAESPSGTAAGTAGGGGGAMPQLLSFRTPTRLSPLPQVNVGGPSAAAASAMTVKRQHSVTDNLSPAQLARSELGWFRHITEASNAYKSRESGRRAGSRSAAQPLPSSSSTDQNGLDGAKAAEESGKPPGRSHSFHESGSAAGSAAGAAGDGKETAGASGQDQEDGMAKKTGSSTGPRKRLQRVEILKIAEPCPLIDPSQVVVTKGEILMADPVLTPIEKLRRKDAEVATALVDKQRLIAEILNIPVGDFDHIADMASQPQPDKDAREVLLAALAQAKSLSDLVNESLTLSDSDRIAASAEVSPSIKNPSSSFQQPIQLLPDATTTETSDEVISSPPRPLSPVAAAAASSKESRFPLVGPPTEKLISISSSMNSHLTTLLSIIQERDEERDRLRRELQRSQDQIHAFLHPSSTSHPAVAAINPAAFSSSSSSSSSTTSSSAARVTSAAAAAAAATTVTSPGSTRPASFISVEESSGADQMSTTNSERNHESEDDAPDLAPKTATGTEPATEEAAASSEGTLTNESSPNATEKDKKFTNPDGSDDPNEAKDKTEDES